MSSRCVTIVANQTEAHLPVMGRFRSGLWYQLAPVLSVPLRLDAICEAIQDRLAAGHPLVDDSVRPSLSAKDAPLLRATKSRSWKQMASKWCTYSLTWNDKGVHLDVSYRDKQGRWQYDGKKYRTFALDTPLETIVAVILEDVPVQMEALAAL